MSLLKCYLVYLLLLSGMNSTSELKLVRDIVGVKPLYYYHDIKNKKFYFSSLIKPILLSKK